MTRGPGDSEEGRRETTGSTGSTGAPAGQALTVLPELVCPYAKMVPLNPSVALLTIEEACCSYTCFVVHFSPNTWSYAHFDFSSGKPVYWSISLSSAPFCRHTISLPSSRSLRLRGLTRTPTLTDSDAFLLSTSDGSPPDASAV